MVFLFAYLNLARWHVRYSHVALLWLVFLAGLVALAVVDRRWRRASPGSRSRRSPGRLLLVVYLAAHNGYDRAILLIPTWLLLTAWVVAAGFAITGSCATTSCSRR